MIAAVNKANSLGFLFDVNKKRGQFYEYTETSSVPGVELITYRLYTIGQGVWKIGTKLYFSETILDMQEAEELKVQHFNDLYWFNI